MQYLDTVNNLTQELISLEFTEFYAAQLSFSNIETIYPMITAQQDSTIEIVGMTVTNGKGPIL